MKTSKVGAVGALTVAGAWAGAGLVHAGDWIAAVLFGLLVPGFTVWELARAHERSPAEGRSADTFAALVAAAIVGVAWAAAAIRG